VLWFPDRGFEFPCLGDDRRRGLHDRLARTVVVDAPDTETPVRRMRARWFNNEPVPNAMVVLVPDGASRQRRDLFRSTSTDISGRFSIQGIPAATYKAFAFEDVSVDAWQNPDFMRPLESRGTSIEIRDGNPSSADLQVIPAAKR